MSNSALCMRIFRRYSLTGSPASNVQGMSWLLRKETTAYTAQYKHAIWRVSKGTLSLVSINLLYASYFLTTITVYDFRVPEDHLQLKHAWLRAPEAQCEDLRQANGTTFVAADSILATGVLCEWLRSVVLQDDRASPTRTGALGGTFFRFGADIMCSRARGGVMVDEKEREWVSEMLIRSGVGLTELTTDINNAYARHAQRGI